jgi:protein SMG7
VERHEGILKPQGSLERSRDSSDLVIGSEINSLPSSVRKPRQNVAMQAIMRRAETEQKQVTFKNVSPIIIEESAHSKAVPTAIVTSFPSPVKANNVKNIVASSSASNGSSHNITSNAPPIQPRLPLMPNAPLNKHNQLGSVVQQQQQSQPTPPQQQKQQFEKPTKVRNAYNIYNYRAINF